MLSGNKRHSKHNLVHKNKLTPKIKCTKIHTRKSNPHRNKFMETWNTNAIHRSQNRGTNWLATRNTSNVIHKIRNTGMRRLDWRLERS